MGKSFKKLIRIAYHEAGHAVAAFELRRAIKSVDIIPDTEDDRQGALHNTKINFEGVAWDNGNKYRSKIERAVIIFFAGYIAEKKYSCKTTFAFKNLTDTHRALDYLDYLTGSDEESGAYAGWLFVKTQNLMNLPYNWNAVIAVADALLQKRKLSQKECREIIQNSRKNYEEEIKTKPSKK